MFQCKNCKLIQLSNTADIKKMYGDHYGYRTSVSKLMLSHLKEKVLRLKKHKMIKKGTNILDIGSNDGSFLKLIGKENNLYGIDPSAKNSKKNTKE